MATVSIIMASYNYAGFIGEAVGSVQAQSFQDWEQLNLKNQVQLKKLESTRFIAVG